MNNNIKNSSVEKNEQNDSKTTFVNDI